MSSRPQIKISVLRDIGWRHWDPIGLQTLEGGWEGSNAADEYDRYLLRAAQQLLNGADEHKIADYLASVETDAMGLSYSSDTRERASRTARELRNYVDTLRT